MIHCHSFLVSAVFGIRWPCDNYLFSDITAIKVICVYVILPTANTLKVFFYEDGSLNMIGTTVIELLINEKDRRNHCIFFSEEM